MARDLAVVPCSAFDTITVLSKRCDAAAPIELVWPMVLKVHRQKQVC
jgi:hypothetical protein